MEILGYIASIVVGLFILVFLVAIHEFGHGVVARRNGVVVEEFGIGFHRVLGAERSRKVCWGAMFSTASTGYLSADLSNCKANMMQPTKKATTVPQHFGKNHVYC